jgi:hypothetical protein
VFISSYHLDFVVIHETKLEVVEERLCNLLWGNSFCEWSFVLSIGNSGGIMSIWSSYKDKSIFSFVKDVFDHCLAVFFETLRPKTFSIQ